MVNVVLSSTALGAVGLLLRMEGMPHSKAADHYEGKCSSIICQHEESLLFEKKPWAPDCSSESRRVNREERRAAVVCGRMQPNHRTKEDMTGMLLSQMAELIKRWEKCANYMPEMWFPVSDNVLIGLADNFISGLLLQMKFMPRW